MGFKTASLVLLCIVFFLSLGSLVNGLAWPNGIGYTDDCIEVFTLESAWDEGNGLLRTFLSYDDSRPEGGGL